MTQYIVAFAFFVGAFAFMALMLQFARYRQRKSSCCGDVLEDFEKGDNCDTCPNRESEACALKETVDEVQESAV